MYRTKPSTPTVFDVVHPKAESLKLRPNLLA